MSDNSDISIHLGDAVSKQQVREKPAPAEGLSTYAACIGNVENFAKPVYIHENALRGIEEHAASSPGKEVGGVLLGDIYCSKGVQYVQVDDWLCAKGADERRAALTFTHETWNQINAEKELKRPDLRIVGWYHTHPGLGVFLSDKDQFIHKNFFREDSLVAMVVDPAASNRAFFYWSGDRMVKAPGFYVFGDASRSADIENLIASLKLIQAEAAHDPAIARSPAVQTEVDVVFKEPCINSYYLLPRYLRLLFGITNSKTAPRISIKSVMIFALLAVIIFMAGQRMGTTSILITILLWILSRIYLLRRLSILRRRSLIPRLRRTSLGSYFGRFPASKSGTPSVVPPALDMMWNSAGITHVHCRSWLDWGLAIRTVLSHHCRTCCYISHKTLLSVLEHTPNSIKYIAFRLVARLISQRGRTRVHSVSHEFFQRFDCKR